MTSSRPYLVRALNDWILANDCTPYILVNALNKGVKVPQEYVKDGQIILNISPAAVQSLVINDEAIGFHGRFAGVPQHVFVPMRAVMGIYSKENGQGMIFDTQDERPDPPDSDDDGEQPGGRRSGRGGKPPLRIVK